MLQEDLQFIRGEALVQRQFTAPTARIGIGGTVRLGSKHRLPHLPIIAQLPRRNGCVVTLPLQKGGAVAVPPRSLGRCRFCRDGVRASPRGSQVGMLVVGGERGNFLIKATQCLGEMHGAGLRFGPRQTVELSLRCLTSSRRCSCSCPCSSHGHATKLRHNPPQIRLGVSQFGGQYRHQLPQLVVGGKFRGRILTGRGHPT
mmetsp:Transcript_19278/g.38910  ORF Transcript_19278/g.38910 Transcript_19278/m.38910 type:complete len:201 (+) Transcript_19278:463-1065(+)